ncbi:hypothetical protein OsI_19132 [Oryza sativa Indica Group]|uniref:Uncharacterized protein n=2 Tax=Oryza sativa TaxID=4530 RepID=B9FNG2_ORYSJ|nr:hypothetical protein OsI_19132 [Oryza sativa Indica Group]EEE62964.1 hypothetical protein OsJ_17771 [Oryza sativa Japonica Group]
MLPAALLPHLLIPPMMGRIASPLIPPKPGRITWPRSGRTPGTPMTSSPPMLWSTRCWSNASALLWSPPPRIRSPSPSLSRSWTYNEPLLAAILVSTAKSCSALADLRRINLDGLRWCVFDAKGQDRDRKLRIFSGNEHPFHDRPLEPFVMPPRQVQEMRPRARRALLRAQKKEQDRAAASTKDDENAKNAKSEITA